MKLHLACGDVYLDGYVNIDIDGKLVSECSPEELDANRTTLDKYFKYPFEFDINKRVRRSHIVDIRMNVLHKWPWADGLVDELVSVSAFEHFEHQTELPHIINEAHRVLKTGGIWKFDFPDIRKIVELYHDDAPLFMSELIYCNHKNKYSVHQWGYTEKSVSNYVTLDKWRLEFKDVVSHCYPMQGVWATKI